jgi:hypothetical protein
MQKQIEFESLPKRKATVLSKVHQIMLGGSWTTPLQLQQVLKFNGMYASDSAVTARIRDLRKKKYGSHEIEKRPLASDSSQWEYRVVK